MGGSQEPVWGGEWGFCMWRWWERRREQGDTGDKPGKVKGCEEVAQDGQARAALAGCWGLWCFGTGLVPAQGRRRVCGHCLPLPGAAEQGARERSAGCAVLPLAARSSAQLPGFEAFLVLMFLSPSLHSPPPPAPCFAFWTKPTPFPSRCLPASQGWQWPCGDTHRASVGSELSSCRHPACLDSGWLLSPIWGSLPPWEVMPAVHTAGSCLAAAGGTGEERLCMGAWFAPSRGANLGCQGPQQPPEAGGCP